MVLSLRCYWLLGLRCCFVLFFLSKPSVLLSLSAESTPSVRCLIKNPCLRFCFSKSNLSQQGWTLLLHYDHGNISSSGSTSLCSFSHLIFYLQKPNHISTLNVLKSPNILKRSLINFFTYTVCFLHLWPPLLLYKTDSTPWNIT